MARYAFCKFAMVEYRWFAVRILMMYVIVSEILVLPVIWPPSWIYGTYLCPMTSVVPLLKGVRGSPWNFLAMCSRARDLEICLGVFLPPVAGKRRKKTVDKTRVKDTWVTTLTFLGDVTSSVTWLFVSPYPISYSCPIVPKPISPALFETLGPKYNCVTTLTFLGHLTS